MKIITLLTLLLFLSSCNTQTAKFGGTEIPTRPNYIDLDKTREGRYNLKVVGKIGEPTSKVKERWNQKAAKTCEPDDYFARMSQTFGVDHVGGYSKSNAYCIPTGNGCNFVDVTDTSSPENSTYIVMTGEVICEKNNLTSHFKATRQRLAS